jgi:hypothetical protein
VGYLEQGRLLFSEEMSVLSDRFREITITLSAPSPVPKNIPPTWLQVEAGDAVIRFVDSDFHGQVTTRELAEIFPSIPYRDHVSLPLAFCFCGVVVVLQYASRRVWISRVVLGALPILLVLTGMTVSESTEMRRDYPRASAGQEAPVQLALLENAPHPAAAYLDRSKQVRVSIPLQVSGVAEGYGIVSGPVKVSVDAAKGSHWNSAWQALNNQQYLPGTSESWITFQMSRAFFDQVRSTPVMLHFTVALTRVQAGNVRSIPLPMQDFPVPDFGICSPQADVFHSRFFGILPSGAHRSSSPAPRKWKGISLNPGTCVRERP